MDRPILRKEKKVVHIWCHSVEQLHTTPCTYGGKADKEANSRKYKQKAPADMSFIREKTYTLPITLARGLSPTGSAKIRAFAPASSVDNNAGP